MEVNPHLTENARKDYQLVERAINAHDQQAYAELMNRYRETVYYMLLRMTNSSIDAEDLTLEAFGKAFKSLHNYSPKYAFSTWLFRIASNNCIDYLRKKGRTDVYDDSVNIDDPLRSNLPSQEASPEEKFMRKERLYKVKVVVDKLKPHYRQLVELRYFKEYSYEEIATQLDLPLGTVKAKLFRAREFLQNLMGDRSL